MFKRFKSVEITNRASQQLLKISRNPMLRVQVDAGGCHGFQYKMDLIESVDSQDFIFEKDGAKVVIDPITLDMIDGSKIDFCDELIGSSFQVVDNPHAETSCGCKISFNFKE